jgi:hypothetical protein
MAQKASAAKEPATAEQTPGNTTTPDTTVAADVRDQPAQEGLASSGEPASADEEPVFSFTVLKPARIHGRKRMPGDVVNVERGQLQILDAQGVIDIEA